MLARIERFDVAAGVATDRLEHALAYVRGLFAVLGIAGNHDAARGWAVLLVARLVRRAEFTRLIRGLLGRPGLRDPAAFVVAALARELEIRLHGSAHRGSVMRERR